MSETMTDDEHKAIVRQTCELTRRACLWFSTGKQLVTPFQVWAGGRCKTQPVTLARAYCGLALRCTIGRSTKWAGQPAGRTPSGKTKRVWLSTPWAVYATGIPTDGSVQQFLYVLIAPYVGGADHTLFILAIQRLKRQNPELAEIVMDKRDNKTALATEVAWFNAIEAQQGARLLKINALNTPLVSSQITSQAAVAAGTAT